MFQTPLAGASPSSEVKGRTGAVQAPLSGDPSPDSGDPWPDSGDPSLDSGYGCSNTFEAHGRGGPMCSAAG